MTKQAVKQFSSEPESDDRLRFPLPFGGIEHYIQARDQRELDLFVLRLLACGHQHHFAVSGDGVWVSSNAVDWGCLDGKKPFDGDGTFAEGLADMLTKCEAQDMTTNAKVPCNVTYDCSLDEIEVEFEANRSIHEGLTWVDRKGRPVFNWRVQQVVPVGSSVNFTVELS